MTVMFIAASNPTDSGYVYEILRHLGTSPSSAHSTQVLLTGPLKIIVVLVVAFLAARIGSRILRRVVQSLQQRSLLGDPARRAGTRVHTVANLLASIWRTVIWIVAILTILGVLGINLTPFIAGATVIGAALGFGAQSLVKDVLSGFFIIVEDQYGIGDTITIGDVTGTVEDVNLRVTQIRAVDGKVWYFPNGEVRKVANDSLGWSRVLVDVVLPLGTDIEGAARILAEEAAAVATDSLYANACLGQPEVWGVEGMDSTSVTLRLAIKTTIGRNPQVARAIRTRISTRLVTDGLIAALPSPPS
ncbi:MAG: mechanosensitive ion channel family protein [Acidimicrobiales bacterium]